MGNEQVAPETKGVTVEVLSTVDLASEIEGMEGRQLRTRMVTIEPGGVLGRRLLPPRRVPLRTARVRRRLQDPRPGVTHDG